MEGNLFNFFFLLGPFKVEFFLRWFMLIAVFLMSVELVNCELPYIWLNVGGDVVLIKMLAERSSKFRGIVLLNWFQLYSPPFFLTGLYIKTHYSKA